MIKTWRERLGLGADFPLHAPTDVERAMEAEIAELRLTARRSSVPADRRIRALQTVCDEHFNTILELRADDADNLSVMLWLLRRLPRAYENPPHVVGPILKLAKRTGTDVAKCLAERAGSEKAQAGETQPTRYNEALELVRKENRGSVAMVQRVLQIGWAEAESLIELMVKRGDISRSITAGLRAAPACPGEEGGVNVEG